MAQLYETFFLGSCWGNPRTGPDPFPVLFQLSKQIYSHRPLSRPLASFEGRIIPAPLATHSENHVPMHLIIRWVLMVYVSLNVAPKIRGVPTKTELAETFCISLKEKLL